MLQIIMLILSDFYGWPVTVNVLIVIWLILAVIEKIFEYSNN